MDDAKHSPDVSVDVTSSQAGRVQVLFSHDRRVNATSSLGGILNALPKPEERLSLCHHKCPILC